MLGSPAASPRFLTHRNSLVNLSNSSYRIAGYGAKPFDPRQYLIGNGHFLSHFYVLCLPSIFLIWQSTFHVGIAELGMTIMFMSGTTALLQTPVSLRVDHHGARPLLVGGALITPVPLGILIDKGHPDLVLVAVTLLLSLFCAGAARVSEENGRSGRYAGRVAAPAPAASRRCPVLQKGPTIGWIVFVWIVCCIRR